MRMLDRYVHVYALAHLAEVPVKHFLGRTERSSGVLAVEQSGERLHGVHRQPLDCPFDPRFTDIQSVRVQYLPFLDAPLLVSFAFLPPGCYNITFTRVSIHPFLDRIKLISDHRPPLYRY